MRNRNEKQQVPLQAKWIGYAVTVAIEVLLTIGLEAIESHFPLSSFPIPYILVIMAVAYVFGEGPAILAFIIGLVLFTYFFVPPVHFYWPPANTPEGWARLMAFFIGAFIVGFAMLLIRRSKERIERLAKTLQTERDILQAIMESTNAHIAYLDSQMNFIMVNSTYAEGSGHTKEELIGRNHFDLFPNPENQAIFEKVRDTGEAIEYKARPFEFADQPWRGVTYWDWVLTPIKDASGCVQGLVLSLVDVTDVIRSKQFSDALNEIDITINSTLDFDEIMRRVVVESAKAMGVESAVIALNENGVFTVQFVSGQPAEKLIGVQIHQDESHIMTLAVKTKEPVVLNDTSTDEAANRRITETYNLRSVMLVPLLIRDEVIGNLSFQYHSVAVPFTNLQVNFATKLAASVSLALENARLYQAEQQATARESETRKAIQNQLDILQKALLPGEPAVDHGYQAAAVYVPAYAGQQVGGDFYDVFRTEAGKAGVLIGDVSGKGIEAASLAAAARSTVRAFAYEISSAGEALTHANSVLSAQQPEPGTFVTVFLMILDLPSGDIQYCSAGHPPAAVCRVDGSVEFLTFGQPLIGPLDNLNFLESRSSIQPGEKIVLYTDGVTEARRNSQMFGEDGMEDFLKKHGHLPPRDLADGLVTTVSEWVGGRLTDDAVVIVIERAAG